MFSNFLEKQMYKVAGGLYLQDAAKQQAAAYFTLSTLTTLFTTCFALHK